MKRKPKDVEWHFMDFYFVFLLLLYPHERLLRSHVSLGSVFWLIVARQRLVLEEKFFRFQFFRDVTEIRCITWLLVPPAGYRQLTENLMNESQALML